MKENAHVQGIRQGLADDWERGFNDGYDSAPNFLPGWWFEKPPIRMTKYERGYLAGLEMRDNTPVDEYAK